MKRSAHFRTGTVTTCFSSSDEINPYELEYTKRVKLSPQLEFVIHLLSDIDDKIKFEYYLHHKKNGISCVFVTHQQYENPNEKRMEFFEAIENENRFLFRSMRKYCDILKVCPENVWFIEKTDKEKAIEAFLPVYNSDLALLF